MPAVHDCLLNVSSTSTNKLQNIHPHYSPASIDTANAAAQAVKSPILAAEVQLHRGGAAAHPTHNGHQKLLPGCKVAGA